MVLLVRVDPERGLNRWYSVSIQPTLLDPVAVLCAWGSRRSRYQRQRALPAGSLAEAEALAKKVIALNVVRGYRFGARSSSTI